ncbi:hypothetical protein [Pseudoalteromonas phenolica]|uniref:hypothetical protein n=1 Tax=Pseudoalteromonas phenolica TaxID=161398 RepID=UPI000FFF21AB|nr:hypothetical protein [Pseudoalteromonas phenolica]
MINCDKTNVEVQILRNCNDRKGVIDELIFYQPTLCLAAWLLGCLAAWLLGCLAAWTHCGTCDCASGVAFE